MRDATNLRHRHPRLWELTMSGRVREIAALLTARKCSQAGLDARAAIWVDEQTAHFAISMPLGRYLTLVEATIIDADARLAQLQVEAAASTQFVRLGPSCEHGLKTLVARAQAGDVIYLDAVIDRLAVALAEQGDESSISTRRAKALGILAHPERALALLAAQPEPKPAKAATLYVHVARESLERGAGVARIEGEGPVPIGCLRGLLGDATITVRPVIDLTIGASADGYEISQRFRENLQVRQPFEAFPYGTASSRSCDLDHAIPYARGGPTSTDNLAPLSRRHHRLKTHARGWVHRQISPGVHLWRSPTGMWVRTDWQGTHQLGRDTPSTLEQRLAAHLGMP